MRELSSTASSGLVISRVFSQHKKSVLRFSKCNQKIPLFGILGIFCGVCVCVSVDKYNNIIFVGVLCIF